MRGTRKIYLRPDAFFVNKTSGDGFVDEGLIGVTTPGISGSPHS
jgi:hypothetical protein